MSHGCESGCPYIQGLIPDDGTLGLGYVDYFTPGESRKVTLLLVERPRLADSGESAFRGDAGENRQDGLGVGKGSGADDQRDVTNGKRVRFLHGEANPHWTK